MSDYPAPEQRRLARRIARGVRETRTLARADQAAFRGVDVSDGPFRFYDEDGNIIFQIGALDDDGNYTTPDFDPTVPPTPETPSIIPTVEGFVVKYDGTYVDDNAPDNLHRVDVHVSATPTFEKDDSTLVGSFLSPDGGSMLVPALGFADPVYVALVAVTTSGVESVPSEEVEAVGGVHFTQEAHVVTTVGPQTVRLDYLPLLNSEHLYWNGLYQPGSEWTRDGKVITLPDATGVLAVDDEITVEYAYILPTFVPYVPIAPIGQTADDRTNYSGTTVIAVPAGALVGDMFVLSARSNGTITINDPRVTFHKSYANGFKVWIGTLSDLTAFTSVWVSGPANNWGGFTLSAIRGSQGETPEIAPEAEHVEFSGYGAGGNLPAVPADYSGALLFWFHTDGIGGVYGDQNWGQSPGWSVFANVDDSYIEINVAFTAESPKASVSSPSIDGNSSWHGVMIPLKQAEM